jgi:hypothetical protein
MRMCYPELPVVILWLPLAIDTIRIPAMRCQETSCVLRRVICPSYSLKDRRL